MISKTSLMLKIKLLNKHVCPEHSPGRCSCTAIGTEDSPTGCVELTEVVNLLEAMTDSEYEYIKNFGDLEEKDLIRPLDWPTGPTLTGEHNI